jgi:hypothetical protein
MVSLVLAACGGSYRTPEVKEGPVEPLPISGSFFVPGEQMTFRLSVAGVEGGEAVIAIGQPGKVNGRNVYIARSRVESSGVLAAIKEVRDDVETWIDLDTGYPVYLRADMKFGRIESLLETEFARGGPGSFQMSFTNKGQRRRTLRQLMPMKETPFEGHALLGAVRAWRGTTESPAYFYLLAGKRLWHNVIQVTDTEEIETELGEFEAVRIDGMGTQMTHALLKDLNKEPRQYTAWISNDERRLPLLLLAKTEYGDIRVELIDYQAP